MVLASIGISPATLLEGLVVIVGLLLTGIAVARRSAFSKKRSKTNTPISDQSFQPSLPPRDQIPSHSKDNTAIIIALIGTLATIIAALITALVK